MPKTPSNIEAAPTVDPQRVADLVRRTCLKSGVAERLENRAIAAEIAELLRAA